METIIINAPNKLRHQSATVQSSFGFKNSDDSCPYPYHEQRPISSLRSQISHQPSDQSIPLLRLDRYDMFQPCQTPSNLRVRKYRKLSET